MRDLRNVRTRNQLFDFLNIKKQWGTFVLYKIGVDNCYTFFSIPKKSGGERSIWAPNRHLITIQKRISEVLYIHEELIWREKNISPVISHGFEKNKSIITNASVHTQKRIVLNIDLENFFESIHFGRVRGFFERNEDFMLPREVATTLAQFCCYFGYLPQGAPTSPVVANMICRILDYRVLSLARKYKLDYTRYADDLTFSTNDRFFIDNYYRFIYDLETLIIRSGFKINESKMRLTNRSHRQEVTGLVVNDVLNTRKKFIKETRAMAHSLYVNNEFDLNGVQGNINQLRGRFAFINQIDKFNNIKNYKKEKVYSNFTARERQYQKFLFFTTFYKNNKPLVVTEGKTDIIYLKAALKKMYREFPELITKDGDGFQYHIKFLNKTNTLSYILKVNKDGASCMQKIVNYYTDCSDKNYTNYCEKFEKLGVEPDYPVFLLIDNEDTSKKPLQELKIDKAKKDILKTHGHILYKSNLHLLTPKKTLKDGDLEIEDLFDERTLGVKLRGKSFSRNDECETDLFYGKVDFANYIMSNYNIINFDRFREILNSIKSSLA